MVRKERTEILVNSPIAFLKKLANIIESQYELSTIEKPNSGLVMMKMRESAKKHLFYLGEVFVTECKVLLNDVIGLGIIQGSHSKKAHCLAVIDAAYNAHVPETILLDRLLEKASHELKEAKRHQIAHLLKTKVDFETLDEEVKA